jgi:hypothetical protein
MAADLGPPDEPRHPILGKLLVVWPLAILLVAASRAHPLWWPLLVYGWALATSGGLLALWWVERHVAEVDVPLRVQLLVRLCLRPGMKELVGAQDVSRARAIQRRLDRARRP